MVSDKGLSRLTELEYIISILLFSTVAGQEKGLGKLEVFYQGAKLPSHNGITLLLGIWSLRDTGHDV